MAQAIHSGTHYDVHTFTDWKAGLWAGLVAGLVFMALQLPLATLVLGHSPWTPPRMVAAIVMGPAVLQSTAVNFGVMALAILIHYALSALYGVGAAWLVHRYDIGLALLIGAVYGLGLYVTNFLGFTVVFPWFAEARNWVTVIDHLIFGMVAAAAYVGLRGPVAGRPEVRDRPLR